MDSLSSNIISILKPFSKLFSAPSWKKSLTLLFGTIICTGKRTVCSALRAMGLENETSFSKYHHLLNRTNWSLLKAAKILFFILLPLIKNNPIILDVDETLERRKGAKIKAKGYYRDAVRSSKSQVVKTTGLKWLVMALSVRLPFTSRAFALPFLTVLEYSKKYCEKKDERHKTTVSWTKQMILQVRRWVGKKKKIILVGDGGFATAQLSLTCICHNISLVSRLKMNARLFDFPLEVPIKGRGRPSLKGKRLVNFKEMLNLKKLPWKDKEIVSYRGMKRLVRFASSTCMWGGGNGLMPIPIRWVLVVDPTGRMDPLPLMSTGVSLTPEQIIELYVDRWSLEVTFEETREHLGVETQRQWSDKAIARSTPILMGLYSLVCLMANRLGETSMIKIEKTAWYKKSHITFSDMLRAVRITIWRENLITQKGKIIPSLENITPKMLEWAEALVRRMLQAA
jgi:hypothetical protein